MDVFNRVLDEFTELNHKIDKLDNFIHNSENGAFESLAVVHRALLLSQLDAMRNYSHILSLRLSALENTL